MNLDKDVHCRLCTTEITREFLRNDGTRKDVFCPICLHNGRHHLAPVYYRIEKYPAMLQILSTAGPQSPDGWWDALVCRASSVGHLAIHRFVMRETERLAQNPYVLRIMQKAFEKENV